MAITLDELLGRNTQSVSRSSVESFPSYEEFNASRAQGYTQQPVQNNVRYNFDTMPQREVRSTESVRAYEASRPYVTPQNSEYQTRDYAFYDNLRQREQTREQYQPAYNQAPVQTYDRVQPMQYAQPVEYVKPQEQVAPQSFYEFTAQDSERLSGEELYDKLAYTHPADAPVFEQKQQAQRTSVFARKAQTTQDTTETRQRAKLNTKGKIILGVYIAVIALVASLIIVNATKINQGKAVTPTSSIELVQETK